MTGERRFTPADRMERLPEQFFAALTERAAHLAADGHDVINLGQGNPDLPTPPHIVQALREAVLDPVMHRYTRFRGLSELREAICAYYACVYGVTLDPEEEVAILFGGKAGLVEVSQCLLNEGDLAIVPDPGYPDYWSGIALAGGRMQTLPLRESNQFRPDFSELPVETLRSARLMFLNYPNNPTAATATTETFAEAVALAAKYGFAVAHDFAYGSIAFEGKPPSFLQTPGARDVGVEFYTLSKTYNMAGWRVGFALGNRDIVRMLNTWQDHSYVSLFGAVQRAAAVALKGDQSPVTQLVETYRRRRDAFLGTLARGGWRTLSAPGSFFVWVPVPAGQTAMSTAETILTRAKVVLAPGVGFGGYGEGYVRIGMLAPEDRLVEAAQRILRAF